MKDDMQRVCLYCQSVIDLNEPHTTERLNTAGTALTAHNECEAQAANDAVGHKY